MLLLLILLGLGNASIEVNWQVKQCEDFNGKAYKKCNDLHGCKCDHEKIDDNPSCTKCVDACTKLKTKEACQADVSCEFKSKCERIDLFREDEVRQYNIEVKEEDWNFINKPSQWEQEPYVPCILTMNYKQDNEKKFEMAKCKVKGSAGSKIPCQGSVGKVQCRSLSYQVDVDRNRPEGFDDKNEPFIGGKDKIQFHAMMNDRSLMIERLSYSFMHHFLGIKTSRAVHCVVFLNGEKLGVFLNAEELDEASIGPLFFGETGTMHKEAWPQDFGVYAEDMQVEGMTLMENLITEAAQCLSRDRLKMQCSPEEGKKMLQKFIETDAYVRVMLANIVLNNFDGTPFHAHNHYWFQKDKDSPYVFVPWDYNNLIMTRFCKVNENTGMIEGFGELGRDNSRQMQPLIEGICDNPPFQYLPKTQEERDLICQCIPQMAEWQGTFNTHLPCQSAVHTVMSQSLVNDFFALRDSTLLGKEDEIKNQVQLWLTHWSNQIRSHIDSSKIQHPPLNYWEKQTQEIPNFFNYGLDQTMNRKQSLKQEDVDARINLIRKWKDDGKCTLRAKGGCESDKECQYCQNKEMGYIGICGRTDQKCYVGNHQAEECKDNKGRKDLTEGWFCVDEGKYALCEFCEGEEDCEYEGCRGGDGTEWAGCGEDDGKCYHGISGSKDCEGNKDVKPLDGGWFCFNEDKVKQCPARKSDMQTIPNKYSALTISSGLSIVAMFVYLISL